VKKKKTLQKKTQNKDTQTLSLFEGCDSYTQDQFNEGLKRILKQPALNKIIASYFPSASHENLNCLLKTIKNTQELQEKIISPTIAQIHKKSSSGLSFSGIENLSHEIKYLFISNHRDILCDPSLLTNILFLNGFITPKICLGDNLLTSSFIIDLVKMNKGITIKRNLPPRDLLKYSKELSQFIHTEIAQNKSSIWIAQREGRSKDGKDLTHPGILKMLTLEGEGSPSDQIENLNIVPIAISYEYDPCDFLKAKQRMFLSMNGHYEKSEKEDELSMTLGITEPKGRIHIGIGEKIHSSTSSEKKEETKSPSKNDYLLKLAKKIDHQILSLYHPWPSHYIAFDLIRNSDAFESIYYTKKEKAEFLERMQKKLDKSEFSADQLAQLKIFFLEIYSNSIVQKVDSSH
jgi:hypothetical protein